MSGWNPDLYLKFANERTQPSLDLIHRIGLAAPGRVIDLGCGTGNSTEALRRRWPDAEVTGLDNSPAMLAQAARNDPDGHWVQADLNTWTAERPYDLVFSNATLQWVKDHAEVMPRLLAQVAPAGALAVQMPHSGRMPVRRAILETAAEAAWDARMSAARDATAIEDERFYYDHLAPHATRFEMWVTEYQHVMDGPAAILEWIRATSLRPFLDALRDAEERKTFESSLLARLARDFPQSIDGRVLFPFPRLFFVAYR